MQQYILSKKNVITVISGLLIALGFFSHFVLENVGLSESLGLRQLPFKRFKQ